METITIRSWCELNEIIWPLLYEKKYEKYRTYTAFRGQDRDYKGLKTTLQRLVEDPKQTKEKESRLINRFKTYAIDSLQHGQTDWDVLLLGQHHRLPTRLLDWTASPFIALYFACEDKQNEDGEIWCANRQEINKLLPKKLNRILEKQRGYCFTIETLTNEFNSLEDFDSLGKKMKNESLIFFEPPSVDKRIINQFSVFSIMTDPNARTDEFLVNHQNICKKIIIPCTLKKEFLERLFILNISARTVYPDLGGISKMLGWYFK